MHAKPSAAQQSRRPAAIMPACPDRRMDCVQQMVLNDEVAALRSRCTDYGPTPDGVEDIGLVQLAAAYGYADMLALLLEYRTDTRTDMAMAVFDAPLRLVCNTSYTPPDTPATCRRGGSGGSGGGGGGGGRGVRGGGGGRGCVGGGVLAAPPTRDYTAVARMLLAAGANVHCRDPHGRTPLHLTALDGGFEVASLLIEQGARLGDTDYCGRTAMHMAALQVNVSMVLVLLACGADLTVQDNTGSTPMDLAIQHQLPPRICRLLHRVPRPTPRS